MTEVEAMKNSVGEPLFGGIYFAVVKGGNVDDGRAASLIHDLETRGAVHCRLDSTELRHLTHLIADTHDFPAYQDAVDGFIHVVKPIWVEQSISKQKTANLLHYRPDPRLFMADVIYTFAEDIPPGDQDAIMGGMHAMGAVYSSVMTKQVTHVVSLTMDNKQASIVVDKSLRCKIVLPHWFDHCLTLGKKIDEAPYMLPNPPYSDLNEYPEAYRPKSNGCADSLAGATSLEPPPLLPVSPSKGRRELNVLRDRKIMLSADLDIAPHLRCSIADLIHKAGGDVASTIDSADTLVCKYRHGLDFSKALDTSKDIGNLSWLYHVINTNKWTTPTRRLLHYPVPKASIRGFKDFKISVSNYTGEARIYLENLIKAAGGTFTKTMTQANTHLITAHDLSEKVDAAKEWNIATVNHLWLEESYAKCKTQSMTNGRYTTFPQRTNLGEVVGQTQIDKGVLEEIFLPHRFTSPVHEEPSAVLEPKSSNARTPGSPTKSRKIQQAVTPGDQGKENFTPGSRGAKDRALNKLHSMASDIAQYQKETKRRGGVVYGGRRVSDVDRIQLPTRKRLSSSRGPETASDGTSTDAEDGAGEPKNKKKKTQQSSEVILNFVVTGGNKFGWSTDKKLRMRKLGLREIDEVPKNNNFDVLVSPQVLRTPNFLAAVAAGAPIVRPAWLEDTLKAGHSLDVLDYELLDPSFEQGAGPDLATILERARDHRAAGGMLKGMTIYCTDSVKCGLDKIVDVISRNGGTCVPYKGRETVPCFTAPGDKGTKLHLVSVLRDKPLWGKFRSMASGAGYRPQIVTADWILQVCLYQDLCTWADGWDLES